MREMLRSFLSRGVFAVLWSMLPASWIYPTTMSMQIDWSSTLMVSWPWSPVTLKQRAHCNSENPTIVSNIKDSILRNLPFLRWVCWFWWDPAYSRVRWQGAGNQHAEGELWLWEGGDDWRWCYWPWGLPSSCKYNQLSCMTKHQLLFIILYKTVNIKQLLAKGMKLWCCVNYVFVYLET